MGCGSGKVVPLPETPESIPSLSIDDLPVEIIYKILDELDLCTIFLSLYSVCKRFHEIVSTYDQYDLNLKTLSLPNLNVICSRIRPDQITKLTISDDENNPGLIELFFSRFSINTFVRLRSLTLIQINNEEFMNQILITIADQSLLLNFSSIKIINSDETYDDIFVELIMSVLIKPSLRKIHFELSYSRTTSNPLPWIEQCSIRHITFNGTCSINFVRNTFIHTPYLITFKADDFDFDDEIDLNNVPNNLPETPNLDELEVEPEEIVHNDESGMESPHIDDEDDIDDHDNEEIEIINNHENPLPREEKFASIGSTDNLTSFTLNTCTMSMAKLEWILKEMLVLKQLRLITATSYDDESILNGHRWEMLLLNIEKFEFIFSVNLSNSSLWDIDTCITRFRTSFWTEEKQWFVSLEKYVDEVILHTLPYINHFYVGKNESTTFEYRTTAIEKSLLHIQAMKNVHDLYIETSKMAKLQIENIPSPRFSHITHLFLYGRWSKSKSFLTDLKSIVNLNTVEELNRDEYVPTVDFIGLLELMPHLQSIKTTTNLLDALNARKFCYEKCLRSFIVDPNTYTDERSVNIEPFCDMFPRIQHLTIPVDSVESCQYALDQLNKDLTSVNFRISMNDSTFEPSDDDDNENDEVEISTDDMFTEWIRELPKQYRCHRRRRQIHICLK